MVSANDMAANIKEMLVFPFKLWLYITTYTKNIMNTMIMTKERNAAVLCLIHTRINGTMLSLVHILPKNVICAKRYYEKSILLVAGIFIKKGLGQMEQLEVGNSVHVTDVEDLLSKWVGRDDLLLCSDGKIDEQDDDHDDNKSNISNGTTTKERFTN
eukprot:14128252-Ditylum_brightwellii.AAC.1